MSRWQIQRILYQFSHIVRQIHRGLDGPLAATVTLSPEDEALLRVWNGEPVQPVERCVHELIQQQCAGRPDALAICGWDGNLTYRQLEERSSRLASSLMRLGFGPETFVPLCFKKSCLTAVAMLGVLKAGAALVLLDPSHPAERLRQICQDVSARPVVSSVQEASRSSSLAAVVVVLDDRDGDGDGQTHPSQKMPSPKVQSSNAAYAAYTSGSAGAPKGVVIEHGAFCTSALAHGKAFGVSAASRVFQFASYAFDAQYHRDPDHPRARRVCCVPSEAGRRENLAETVAEFQANWFFLTLSLIKLLQPDQVPSIQTIILGGEPVALVDVEIWADRVQLVLCYGPTECSAISTAKLAVTCDSDPRNIGLPIGCVCWIVNQRDPQRLAPIGAVGELLIEGPTTGRTYINRPDQTAAAFVRDPVWLQPLRRAVRPLYKTGDLVRYEPDGSIQYVGRKDTRVKLRGQRIELGEVKQAVRRNMRNVKDVVAAVVTPTTRRPMLVAFVWLAGLLGDGHESSELLAPPNETSKHECCQAERVLRECLPPYMVPAFYFPLAQLPLTLNGKADRRRLMALASRLSRDEISSYATAQVQRCQPETDRERTVQALVAQVLHLRVEDVDIEDSFLHQGGDSMAVMELVALAQEAQLSLSTVQVLGAETLAELACSMLSTQGQTTAEEEGPFSQLGIGNPATFVEQTVVPQLPGVSVSDIEDVLPATELQLFFWKLRCEYFRLHLRGHLDRARFDGACQRLLQRHSILRTVFWVDDDQLLQVVFGRCEIPVESYTCNTDPAEFIAALEREDSIRPLAMTAPSVRFMLVTHNQAEHTLVMRMPLRYMMAFRSPCCGGTWPPCTRTGPYHRPCRFRAIWHTAMPARLPRRLTSGGGSCTALP